MPGRFERIQHVRKKYACPSCEQQGESPQITAAAKPEMAIDKGLAGPGLLAYIVTSKFADYLPLYRLEDGFDRQGFAISRGTQSVWCRDVAEVAEPLYQLIADGVRASYSTDGAIPIDNNVSEREMKRIVLNRKNSLFVGNERDGQTATILASLASTCRRHDVDPQRYLTQLLVNVPSVTHRQLAAWLPDQRKQRQRAPFTNNDNLRLA